MNYIAKDDRALPPRDFFNLVYPAWARVFIELTTEFKESDIGWHSDTVHRTFMRLAGFDPFKVQFSEQAAQLSALNSCTELTEAIFIADEVEQLDGIEALEYAAGWMCALDWLAYEVEGKAPDRPLIEIAAKRAATAAGTIYVDKFLAGFMKKAEATRG